MNFWSGLTQTEIRNRQDIMQRICRGEQAIAFEAKYQSLVDKHVILVRDGNITTAYPFSLTGSNKQVYLEDSQQTVSAMCAIDALGIYHTMGEAIRIDTEDQLTGEKIQITVNEKGAHSNTHPNLCVLYRPVEEIAQCHIFC